jgi:hypothetical protein
MQARTQQHNLGRKHRQLSFLALSEAALGVGAPGITNNADDVAAPDVLVLLLKRRCARILLDQLRLADDLDVRADADRVGGCADVCLFVGGVVSFGGIGLAVWVGV